MPSLPPDAIEYRGERLKLTKAYHDYDDYKEDENNIDPSEDASRAGRHPGEGLSGAGDTVSDGADDFGSPVPRIRVDPVR